METSLKLSTALRLKRTSKVAVVGGGGKTTVVFLLAHELESPSIVTTTTHMGVEQIQKADRHFFVLKPEDVEAAFKSNPQGVILFSRENLPNGRTTAPDEATLQKIKEAAVKRDAPLLIEADGSRCLPLKAPAGHEPAIPSFVDNVVVVAGLSGLGRPLTNEKIHRAELFAALSGLKMGEPVSGEGLIKVLCHPQGGLKNIPPGVQRSVLLNRADTPELQAAARGLVQGLLPIYDRVVISSLKHHQVFASFEPLAGVILAAGGSRRMNAPKLILDWRGEPLVRHVVRAALNSGLRQVIIVTGAYADQVKKAVAELPITIVHNPDWDSGQASSVRVGLQALSTGVGGVVFFLGDQPQVPSSLIQSLAERHAQTLSSIVAPLVDGQRGNPVLWDKTTFEDLKELNGDSGGRQLFSKYKVDYIPWHDPGVLLDVDTPEDYQKFKELLG